MGVIAAAQYNEYNFLRDKLSKRYGHAIAKFFDEKAYGIIWEQWDYFEEMSRKLSPDEPLPEPRVPLAPRGLPSDRMGTASIPAF